MKTSQSIRAFAGAIALTALFPSGAGAQGVMAPATGSSVGGVVAAPLRGKPLVVRVHAAWCAECQTTLPDFQAFTAAYGVKVNVLDFDVTDGKTAANAAELARRVGLSVYYDRTKTKPLTVTFIDPNSNAVVAELRGNVDMKDLVAAERAVESRMRRH
jgi:thiol-disulfide isomerase/thioredoxin